MEDYKKHCMQAVMSTHPQKKAALIQKKSPLLFPICHHLFDNH